MARFRALLALTLIAACAGPPSPAPGAGAEERSLAPLPATFENAPSCDGCLSLTVTLRPDGSYVVRERLGSSEFYDFGRWRLEGSVVRLAGGRDAPRRYVARSADLLDAEEGAQGGDLRRAAKLETLRGPFRMTGLYDGEFFKECLTGLAWRLDESRTAELLREEFRKRQTGSILVSVDARFEPHERGEALRVLRMASILNQRGCPG